MPVRGAAAAIDPEARRRLRELVDERYPRSGGGIRRLAKDSGVKEEVIHSWFRKTGPEPSLGSLAKLGKALHLERSAILALMDGVTPPETKEAPAPKWAKGLISDVSAIRKVVDSEAIGLASLQAALEAIQSQLVPPDDDPVDDPKPRRKVRQRAR